MSIPLSRCPRPAHWPALGNLLLALPLLTATPALAQAPAPAGASPNPIARLLSGDDAVFGVFSGEQTREQGARILEVAGADFVLYSMERGPFDLETMRAYMEGMREAGGEDALQRLPVVLRVPPLSGDRDVAADRVRGAVDAGVVGIVFPHVEASGQAALSVELVPELWPSDPEG
ncbi:MAG: hypothetical protein GWM92_19530, partial [Gemmatimonadetes bacterium]|nr:hypothetical protein [Gemmatimonadota bacterium]NIR81005.1 hypothetical protein [Gemmatimonadota bacterium]NIT89826.1 hypothetical protein [Gemmatimonadota bacterium]NIU33615.1 hypothetical protein [Gemmatimonadota bacterium]NIU37868.1 hypothetical protein [Gemmatimonadota bacterium]